MAANLNRNWYVTDPKAGVDLNSTETISVTTNPEVPGPRQAIGTRVQGNNDSVWMFVKASATVTAGNLVAIDAAGNAADASEALLASLAYTIGAAQFGPGGIFSTLTQSVAAPGDYFWAALEASGGLQINSTGSTLRATQLYISGSIPGTVTTSVSTVAIKHMYANTTFAPTGSNSTTDFATFGGTIKVSV